MGFHIAGGHRKIVQTIELHKWREHRHQHDQYEHDFWHFARHKNPPSALMEKVTGHPLIGDCGDYSTAAINYDNLNFIGLGMRLISNSNRTQTHDLK